jgi:hypothetical protein
MIPKVNSRVEAFVEVLPVLAAGADGTAFPGDKALQIQVIEAIVARRSGASPSAFTKSVANDTKSIDRLRRAR